jgi:ribonuclease HII
MGRKTKTSLALLDNEIHESERHRLSELQIFEREMQKSGYKTIAGVDEAGRGPLAGPVVAAACIIAENTLVAGVNDSKQLTSQQRCQLFEILTNHPEIQYGVGVVSSTEIDRINILEATKVAMQQAIDNLKQKPEYILIDGLALPSHPIPNMKIIQGDCRSYLIAAASIIAKETRDRLMKGFHELWPLYGFNQHKGYGTEAHREAIEKHGPCPIHRMSFEPLKSINFKMLQVKSKALRLF